MFPRIINDIYRTGTMVRDERGTWTRELVGYQIHFPSPFVPIPTLPESISKTVDAPFWVDGAKMARYVDRGWISPHNPDGHSYTYRHRLDLALGQMAARLAKNLNSRRVVGTTLQSHDLVDAEIPCMDLLQFLVRDNQLITRVDFRSLDAWGALPGDLAGLQAIAQEFWAKLNYQSTGLAFGPLILQAGSIHIYERDFDVVKRYLSWINENKCPYFKPRLRFR